MLRAVVGGLMLLAGVTALGHAAQGTSWRQPRILVLKPTTRGVVNAHQGEALAMRLSAALRELFPCAKVVTETVLARIIENDRDRNLMSNGDPNVMEKIGKQLEADLIIGLSLFTTGTTHNSPQRHASMSVLDPRAAGTVDRTQADGDGWEWNDKDVVEGLVAELRTVDLCPWLGVVEYSRTFKKDTSWTQGPASESEGGSRMERFTAMEQRTDKWSFTLQRGGIRAPKLTTSGSSTMVSSEVLVVDLKGVSCFPEVNGEVRDDRKITNAGSMVTTRSEGKGSATGPLQEARLTITADRAAGEAETWSLSLSGLAAGASSGDGFEEKKGDCGNWVRKDEKSMLGFAPPFGSMVSGVAAGLRADRGTMKGAATYKEEDGATVTIKWDLRRY